MDDSIIRIARRHEPYVLRVGKIPEKLGASMTGGILSAHSGTNADLISAATELYIKDGDVVLDVTYGRGVFWKRVDTKRFIFKPSDLYSADKSVEQCDFRHLGHRGGSVDVVVFDPPYTHNPGRKNTKHITNQRYNNAITDADWAIKERSTHGMYHHDIINLYEQGMREAKRVLKRGGLLWVKCKDEVSGGKQCWSHVEIFEIATRRLGMYAQDLFILIPTSKTPEAWKNQFHARKIHSYLWIFKRVT